MRERRAWRRSATSPPSTPPCPTPRRARPALSQPSALSPPPPSPLPPSHTPRPSLQVLGALLPEVGEQLLYASGPRGAGAGAGPGARERGAGGRRLVCGGRGARATLVARRALAPLSGAARPWPPPHRTSRWGMHSWGVNMDMHMHSGASALVSKVAARPDPQARRRTTRRQRRARPRPAGARAAGGAGGRWSCSWRGTRSSRTCARHRPRLSPSRLSSPCPITPSHHPHSGSSPAR